MIDAAAEHIVMEESRHIRQQSVLWRNMSMQTCQSSHQLCMHARETMETSRELCRRTACLILHCIRRLT